jgi:lipoprotein-anchoring transpeptidase ErfK/SrfK
MKLIKVFTLLSILVVGLNAKNYFIKQNDICEGTENYQCPNDFESIRNLQIALNRDKKVKGKLRLDGKWGKSTKEAIISFQTLYKLTDTKGWVGHKTKVQLDKVTKNMKFRKHKQVKNVSLMKNHKYTKYNTYKSFKRKVNQRRSFRVFKDRSLLSKANGRNTRLKIDISQQRVFLFVNGKVALSSPCTTGARHKIEPNTRTYRDKHTPTGTFRIQEKIADKRSTIFGKFYRGHRMVFKGDRRKYRGRKARYVGASLKNWMRLTSGGIGLHASAYVKRHPATNGCIRLPYRVSRTIFSKVRKGTKVSIVH